MIGIKQEAKMENKKGFRGKDLKLCRENSPCLGCPDRQQGCHGVCKLYQAFDAKRRRMRENNRKARERQLERFVDE